MRVSTLSACRVEVRENLKDILPMVCRIVVRSRSDCCYNIFDLLYNHACVLCSIETKIILKIKKKK